MAAVKLLVENLVLIIVLAVFLEMLLPAGKMRGYVHLVVGLMIIVAVLQAVAGVVGPGLAGNLPFLDRSPPAGMEQAVRAGRRMAQQDQSEALRSYEAALERQITALASLNRDLTVDKVRLDVPEDRASPSFGRLLGITVRVVPGPGVGPAKAAADADRLQKELGNFYDLAPGSVTVELERGAVQ